MRHIKEVLHLRFEAKLNHRQVARSPRVGPGTVLLYLDRAQVANLFWPLPADIGDHALERSLFPV